DARVAAAVGDEDIALRVPGDVGRTVEDVLLRARSGSTPSAASAFAASARSARARRILDRFRLAPEEKRDAALRIEFHDHGRRLIDDPEVVLGIDANLRGKQKPVDALTDFAREFPVAIEL